VSHIPKSGICDTMYLLNTGQFLMLISKKCPKNIWVPNSLDIKARNLGYF